MSSAAASTTDYQALSAQTLPARLGALAPLTDRLGPDSARWSVKEIGDGNLNLVFIVTSDRGALIVKQALPYVRLVGESWPLPLKRAFFEFHALTRQARRAPGTVPEVYHFDEAQALLVMEFFSPHVILRHSLMAGETHDGLATTLGLFCARTLFRGSDLCMDAPARKADVALFSGNVELCDITETLIFTDPYFDAPRNHHTKGLDAAVERLRADSALKIEVQHLKAKFCNHGETMLHGDLHTGSVMVSGNEAKVIDPEFALYGPMAFDIGMLLANFWMAYFAQSGHEDARGARDQYRQWILTVIEDIWGTFHAEFTRLWHEERTGILYERSLFEAQGQGEAASRALTQKLYEIWRDMLGFAGVEIIRRTLSLAHIAENDLIEDEAMRAHCEAQGLELARRLIVERSAFGDMKAVNDLARSIARKS